MEGVLNGWGEESIVEGEFAENKQLFIVFLSLFHDSIPLLYTYLQQEYEGMRGMVEMREEEDEILH